MKIQDTLLQTPLLLLLLLLLLLFVILIKSMMVPGHAFVLKIVVLIVLNKDAIAVKSTEYALSVIITITLHAHARCVLLVSGAIQEINQWVAMRAGTAMQAQPRLKARAPAKSAASPLGERRL